MIQPIVVDTDVLSFLFKGDTRASRYRPHLEGYSRVISFATVAEIEVWARRRNWGQPRLDQMEQALAAYAVHFPDLALCRIWAILTVNAFHQGRPIAASDAWIAATALQLDSPLLTHNAQDYSMVDGLRIVTEPDP